VQDIFFLLGDLDEDSILNQGVEEAAGDPQVIGGSSLAGGHQGSAAGSRWNLGGQGQPPPNLDMCLHRSPSQPMQLLLPLW
jgi:hypothetical protein